MSNKGKGFDEGFLELFFDPMKIVENRQQTREDVMENIRDKEILFAQVFKNKYHPLIDLVKELVREKLLKELLANFDPSGTQFEGELSDKTSQDIERRKLSEILSRNNQEALFEQFNDIRVKSGNSFALPPSFKTLHSRENEVLRIINPSIKDSELFFFICSVPSMKTLTHLIVNNVSLEIDLLFILLANSLASLSCLVELNISNCQFPIGFDKENEVYLIFGNSLMMLKNLKVFCFLNNQIEIHKVALMLKYGEGNVFTGLERIEKISVGWNNIKNFQKNIEISRNCSKLRSTYEIVSKTKPEINLDDLNTEVPWDALKGFSDFEELKRLMIDVKRGKIDFESFRVQTMNCNIRFSGFKNLKILQLNGFGAITENSFSNLLNSVESLRFLDLSNNKIQTRYIENAYRFAILPNKIETLMFNDNNLKDQGFEVLIHFINQFFEALTVLSVANNQITLIPLMQFRTLRKLNLSKNDFQNNPTETFNFLEMNPRIETLCFKSCKLTLKFLNMIVQVTPQPTWITLDISKNYFFETLDEWKKFKKENRDLLKEAKNKGRGQIIFDEYYRAH